MTSAHIVSLIVSTTTFSSLFLFSTNPRCRKLIYCMSPLKEVVQVAIWRDLYTEAVKDGHLKRDRPRKHCVCFSGGNEPSWISSAKRKWHGKGNNKKKSTEHTTNFSNQCTFSWRQGEINSRLKGYCRGEVHWRVRAVDKYSLSSGQWGCEKNRGCKRRSVGRQRRQGLWRMRQWEGGRGQTERESQKSEKEPSRGR